MHRLLKIIKKLGGLKHILTTQKEFLTKMGIYERDEMIAKNQNFLKKADIYYRLKRLTDDKQMGKLFKVMLIKNQKNNFNLGFWSVHLSKIIKKQKYKSWFF